MSTAILIWCVVQVTLFALVAGVVYLVARRLHASLGSITASVSLALVLALTALAASPWPRWELNSPDRAAKAAAAVTPNVESDPEEGSTVVAPNVAEPADDSMLSPALAAWSAFADALAEPPLAATAAEPEAASLVFSWRTAARWLLIVCLVVGVLRFVWGVWVVRSLVNESSALGDDDAALVLLADLQSQLGVSTPIELRQSPTIATPATVGWRRPTILLPTRWRDWTASELKAVLAHELAHIAARDYRSWLIARLAVAVHFYHPLVHWLAGRLQMEQELAADAMAVRLVGDRQNYLHSLASLALATPQHRLSGPARTLIPGRSLLMRRVEMLREAKGRTSSKSISPITRATAAVCLAVVAVAVAGVRQVASGQDAPGAVAEESPTITPTPANVPRIGLEVLPDNTIYAVSVRPAELLSQPGFKDLAQKLDDVVPESLRKQVSVSQIAEVLVVVYGFPRDEPRFVVRFVEPSACESFVAALVDKMTKADGYTAPSSTVWQTKDQRLTKVDPQTIVLDHFGRSDARNALPPAVQSKREWDDPWQQASDKQLVFAFDMQRFWSQTSPQDQAQLVGGFPMQMIGPLLTDTKWCVASVDAIDGLKIDAMVQCTDDKTAAAVADTSKAALTLIGNMVEQQRAVAKGEVSNLGLPDHNLASVDALFDLAAEFTSETEIDADGQQVKLSFASQKLDAEKVAITTGLLMPAIQAAGEASRRTQSTNNMKHLMLALLNYESTYRHLPPAVVYEELPDGTRVPRSWRVEILPFLEGGAELYQQYRRNEPYDSEANMKVMAKMPTVFRSPSDDSSSTNTSYFAITGPETIFHNEEGAQFAEVTDGTSNTIALVESKRPIAWTKPEDIAYRADEPMPKMKGWHPGGFIAARVDGSVHFMMQDIDEETLRWLIERADGNLIRH
ncbi:M56 family metallopeptidase [Aeoliella sp.]|uniref:M56 family metallopeptidase n=1 Tax=Aeoliella sp. TaxID=2795800 RepID=UPI003CCBB623